MDSQLPPLPATPTTITCVGDDLLREIFLRLPALPSLVRAAFACSDFRRAVRSSPAFRHSFRALHAPPVLGFFLDPNFEVAPAFPCPWRSGDPELDQADVIDVCFPHSIRSRQGYFILDNVSGSTSAYYNPLMQALYLDIHYISLHFYTLSSEDGQAPPRVVCVIQVLGGWARAAVFSSDTKEWQFFPENMLTIIDADMAGRVMRGLIWWPNCCLEKTVVLNTATFQFSLIDVPSPSIREEESSYKLGETKDGKPCLVDVEGDKLVSYFLTADDDSVIKRWMLYKEFPLVPIVKNLTGFSKDEELRHVWPKVVTVIDGFVYLSIFYYKDTQSSELYLSLCLKTSEICKLFKGAYCYNLQSHPYVMAWPPSLLQSKEESETEFTEDSVADDGHVGTEKASSVLVAALESLSQALMDDGCITKEIVAAVHASLHPSADQDGITKNVMATLDAVLRPNEDGDGLLSKITSFDAQLITGRDRILRRSV
ncbi:uncharacterized protein LOC124682219 [Lolium rigidum]|uniref:uncharacterized protein LOC124682219 n=1 Tax=Lolium rigidum TaxID=89674 RepID=UPI001F5E07A6|nr:uncharacterized protein LOC124682219 [Lolium rigidum]